jgi:CubicO group peptidase (beta-lactamase class C family)
MILGAVGILLATGAVVGLRLPIGMPQTVDEAVLAQLGEDHLPGAWVVVIQNGRVVKCVAYGLQNVEPKTPMQTTTYMHIGSVGKMFTAACVMRLVEEGKLKLDDSLASFFAGSPAWWKDVTIRHLLNQTSGFPDYLDSRVLNTDEEYDEADMVTRLQQMPCSFAPGSRWEYSNTNYLLLGILIHRASGMSYAAFLRHKILEPAGVKSIFGEGDPPTGAIQAKGYFWANSWVSPEQPSRRMSVAADGCVWANAQGFVEWDKALDEMKGLPKGLSQVFWTPVRLADGSSSEYGAGWSVEKHNGEPVYTHDGGWMGFSSFYARFPQSHLSVALCVNGGRTDIDALGYEIADLYLQGK